MNLSDQTLTRILDNLYDGLYLVDLDGKITYWNKGAELISGFSAEEVVGHKCSDNILTHVDGQGSSLCLGNCPLKLTIADGNSREVEVYMHHKNGHRIPVSIHANVITDDSGNIAGAVEIFKDLTSRKANALRIEELERLALLDNLTQLANRNYIEKELNSCFEEKKRFDLPFGVIFLDIDHFKMFNDTYGHDVGDKVLKFVSDTLAHSARPFDLFGRWGGEEFIGIVRNIQESNLHGVAERIRLLISTSYISYDNKKLYVTVSLGATMVTNDDTIDSIIKRSDTLLYQSKKNGRNCTTLG